MFGLDRENFFAGYSLIAILSIVQPISRFSEIKKDLGFKFLVKDLTDFATQPLILGTLSYISNGNISMAIAAGAVSTIIEWEALGLLGLYEYGETKY